MLVVALLQLVDVFTTTTTQESAFYKSVMLEVHGGEDWAVQLAMLELDEPVEEHGTPVPEEVGDRPSGDSGGEQSPVGMKSPMPVRPAAVSHGSEMGLALETSPGSGHNAPMGSGRVSPGSGRATPESWTSQRPGAPKTLSRMVMKPFQAVGEVCRQKHLPKQFAAHCW